MKETNFLNIFIVMDNIKDVEYSLKNLKLISHKARIVLLNEWNNDTIGSEYENITIVDVSTLATAHLYNKLPNVPLVAQNIGLGEGEIMEVHVPFGSSYAYRHIGSILQRKWKIVALYRDKKQILPTNATMIKPDDTLLLVGKPRVLDNISKIINRRTGIFPEPFGQNIYLILDFRFDKLKMFTYLDETIYILNRLKDKKLFVRILYPNDFDLLQRVKEYEANNIYIYVVYDNVDMADLIEFDIYEYNIGLVLNSLYTFESNKFSDRLYKLKNLVYLFGNQSIKDVRKSIILMDKDEKMESIASSAFDISEALNTTLCLCDFDPEGDFNGREMIIEYYETLTHIFNMEINIEKKIANPIREVAKMDNILQIAPFDKDIGKRSIFKLISLKVKDYLLIRKKHPKLLIPFDIDE